MIDDPNPRTDPLPAELGDLLDYDRITQHVGALMCEDEFWADELGCGRLTWTLEGFDERGHGQVSVLHNPTGQIVAGCVVHLRRRHDDDLL